MGLTRRDFLKASSALVAAFGWKGFDAFGAEGDSAAPAVVWLQAQGCSGCSVSLLNSISEMTADELLLNHVSLKYHPTLMASAGSSAIAAAQSAAGAKGHVLVVEGAIPTANGGEYCYLWPGLTAFRGVQDFARDAAFVLAVGTCSSFGGVSGGSPNPTGVRSLGSILGTSRVINIPGCPSHPDWIVGTIAHLLAYQEAPSLDSLRRPTQYFRRTIHKRCPYRDSHRDKCLRDLGCNGHDTFGDCPSRQWNAGGAGEDGVNWCVGAGSPCHGCTEPGFPDGMSPFYTGVGQNSYRIDEASHPEAASPDAEGDSVKTPEAPGKGTDTSGNKGKQQKKKLTPYQEQLAQRRKELERLKAERRKAGLTRRGR